MTGSVAIVGTRGYPSYYGGFETAVRHLAPYLAERGWNVDVYCRPGVARQPTGGSITQRFTVGVDSKSASSLSFGLTASLDATMRRPSAALVMNVANGYFLPLFRARGIPTLVNVDGIEWERAKWGKAARAVFRTGASATARFATELVFDSKEIGRRWRLEFNRDGVFIPYGGDDRADRQRQEPGLEAGKYVLMVARFVPENTVPEFLFAASRLANEMPVVIVGSSGYGGALDEAARELADTHDNVRWLGHVSDDDRLHALWSRAGVYFHGHSVGGTNPALVQAMALGVPTVARDTVYNREVLGDAGVFTEPSADAIFVAVRDLMNDPHGRKRRSALLTARAREQYNWQLVCERYEEALSRIARRA